MTFHPDSGGALQRVQVRAGAAAVHRDQADRQEVCGAGLHPGAGFLRHLIFGRFSTNCTKNTVIIYFSFYAGQEDNPAHEAVARVQERDQAELRHSLGNRCQWQAGQDK